MQVVQPRGPNHQSLPPRVPQVRQSQREYLSHAALESVAVLFLELLCPFRQQSIRRHPLGPAHMHRLPTSTQQQQAQHF